jgi:hypothetical protein
MNPLNYQEITSKCYQYEEYTFEHPLLEVDATYIIHLVGNGRYDTILKQLQTYPISRKVYILLNHGYKTCKKDPSITKPPLDLVDANLEIFKHAKEKGTILILEDDFLFDEKILDPFHRTKVNQFIAKKREVDCIYYIGLLPYILFPYDAYHYRTGVVAGAHSVIYSKPFREKIIKDNHKIDDWDEHLFYHTGFVYYTPLCYQLFPDTENSQHWGDHNPILYVCCIFAQVLFNLVHLDTSTTAYAYFYFASKLWIWIVLLLVLLFYKRFL